MAEIASHEALTDNLCKTQRSDIRVIYYVNSAISDARIWLESAEQQVDVIVIRLTPIKDLRGLQWQRRRLFMTTPTDVAATTAVDEGKANQELSARDSKAVKSLRTNLGYVLDPKRDGPKPSRLRTRTLLGTLRYVAIFIFWRLMRSIRYAMVGSIIAALAGTAIGTVASGVGFFIAPPGILAGAGVGLLWGLGKYSWRILAKRAREGKVEGADPRQDERVDAGEEPSSPPPEPKLGAEVEVW